MYTEDEIKEKNIISTVKQFLEGFCITKNGNTYNYFWRQADKTWFNYDCKTKY